MRKWAIVFKIVFRIIFQPSKSYYNLVEEVCKKELYKRPNDPYSMWFLSNHYVRYKKHEEAQILLESLVNLWKNNKPVILLLSKVYFNLRQYNNVVQLLRNPEDIPKKDTAHYYLGYSLIEIGKIKEGIASLKKYLKYHNKDYIVFWKLGYEYYKQAEYNLALEAYRKAERLNPSKKEIKDGIYQCTDMLKRKDPETPIQH